MQVMILAYWEPLLWRSKLIMTRHTEINHFVFFWILLQLENISPAIFVQKGRFLLEYFQKNFTTKQNNCSTKNILEMD